MFGHPAADDLAVGLAVRGVGGQHVEHLDRIRAVALVVGLGRGHHRGGGEIVLRRGGLHHETAAEQFTHKRLEHQVHGEVLLEVVGRAHDGLGRMARGLPDRVFDPVLLAGVDIEAGDVQADLAQVQRDVLREAQFVRRVGQDRVVDHLVVAVALGLHRRGAEAELGMLVGADVVFEDLDPGRVEAGRRAGAAGVVDHVGDHPDDGRLALVVGALPLLVDGAVSVPVGALQCGPVLIVGRRAVGERDDPVLQQVALRVGLNVDRHVLVVRGLAPLGLEVVVLATVGAGEDGRAGGAGGAWGGRLQNGTHFTSPRR